MDRNRIVFITLLGATLSANAFVPVAAEDGRAGGAIANYLQQCATKLECSGSYLVAQHGSIIVHKAVGNDSADGTKPITTDTAFDIGSISKQFTAAAIVRLAEQNRLSLDDSVERFLPGFPYPTITIRHLMNQTSGIPDMMPYYTKQILSGGAKRTVDLSDIVDVLKASSQPLSTKPGAAFSYSNTGYTLLGKIVEKASGKSYASFLHDEFFLPLGMRHTWVRTPSAETLPGTKRAYAMRMMPDGSRKPFDQVPGLYLYGAGGIYSTTGDLLTWATALRSGKAMSAEHWREATTPVRLADDSLSLYGFGLSLKPSILGIGSVSHGGHWRGFKAELTMLPSQDTTIVILTNDSEDDEVEHARDAFIMMLRPDAGLRAE